MPFSGYLVYLGRFNLLLVTVAGAVGCNIGSAIAYWIGAKGGRPLVERYGKWVLMSHHDLDRMTWFFEKYGSITILVGRMLPVVQTFVAFPAGIAKMGRGCVFTSTLRWARVCGITAWPTSGMKLGEKWHTDPRLARGIPSLSSGGGDRAAGGNCLVCLVAHSSRKRSEGGLNARGGAEGCLTYAVPFDGT